MTAERRAAQQPDPHRRRREELRHPLGLDRGEHRLGIGAGQQDVRRPDVDVGPEEAVELGAVVERQRVQLDVARLHPAVDHAGDVLGDERAAREHRALGPRLGPARVHEPQRVVVADERGGRGSRRRAPPSRRRPPSRRAPPRRPARSSRARRRGRRRGTSAAAATSCRPSSATNPVTPACSTMNATSSALSMKLIGTSTAPSRASAKDNVAKCQQLCDSSPIRSPCSTPRAVSALATRLTTASHSR